jgi:hypothetical protein
MCTNSSSDSLNALRMAEEVSLIGGQGFTHLEADSLVQQRAGLSEGRSYDGQMERIREVEELHLRQGMEQDLPLQLASLVGNLRERHPTLVKDIQKMAGVTLKYDFLRLSLRDDADDFKNKQALQDMYSRLSIEERCELQCAYELADGERDAYFLQIVEEDRRQRRKLGEKAVSPSLRQRLDNQSIDHPSKSHSQDGADAVEASVLPIASKNRTLAKAREELMEKISQWHGRLAASLITKTILNRFNHNDVRMLVKSDAALAQLCDPYAKGLMQIFASLPKKVNEWYPYPEIARQLTGMIFARFDLVDLQKMLHSEAILKACCEEYSNDATRQRLLESILQMCSDRNLASQLTDELIRDLSIDSLLGFIQTGMIRAVCENFIKNKLQALRKTLLEMILQFYPHQDLAQQLSEMLIRRFNITELKHLLQSETMLRELCDVYSMDATRQTT